eukprot:12533116-Alexandrium_andersonii.AAC.1
MNRCRYSPSFGIVSPATRATITSSSTPHRSAAVSFCDADNPGFGPTLIAKTPPDDRPPPGAATSSGACAAVGAEP